MKTQLTSCAFLILFFISSFLFAQKPPIKLGDVSKSDIEMKVYEPDPSADAVVLCDYGYLTFKYNVQEGQWENSLKRTCRIKILNDDGYKWATEKISLYDNNKTEQSISGIKGFSYNIENGKIQKTKLSKDNIFTEKSSKNYKQVKFTMPNVKEGSVIEYSYTIYSNYITTLEQWRFQRSIPVKWSEYKVCIPEYLTYLKNAQGYGSFYKFETSTKSQSISWTSTNRATASLYGSTSGSISKGSVQYKDDVMHWIAKDLPALKDENFVGNYKNYLLSIDFQLSHYKTFSKENHKILSDWSEVIDKFLHTYDNFGPNVKKRSFYKDVTAKIISEYQDPVQRTVAVYNYVSQYMKWNKKYGYIPSENIKKSYQNRTGSCADINALLVSMLRAVEIDADPVIISTVENGLVHPIYPMLSKYNYLIVKASFVDKTVLLDATEKNIPFGLLPYRCLNILGYAVSETNPGWVSLNPSKGRENATMCVFDLDEAGTLKGNITYKKGGYSAMDIRKKLNQVGEEKYVENLKSTSVDWSIAEVNIDAPKEISQPIKEKLQLEIENAAEVMGNMIYINPILCGKIEENPFKQDKRELPIEFIVPFKNNYMFNLVLPDGYVVDELPESINVSTPDKSAILKYVVRVTGNRIQLSHVWQVKKSYYTADKFGELKEFYALLVSKQNEQIVLKKAITN